MLIDELLQIDGGEQVRIVTIDTGVLFEETLATWRAFEERFGIAVEVFDASAPEGIAGPGPSTAARRRRSQPWSARSTAPRAGSPASAASRGRRASRRS